MKIRWLGVSTTRGTVWKALGRLRTLLSRDAACIKQVKERQLYFSCVLPKPASSLCPLPSLSPTPQFTVGSFILLQDFHSADLSLCSLDLRGNYFGLP